MMYRTLPVTQGDVYRLSRLLWIFAALAVVLISPFLVGRIQYAISAAEARAKYDVAKEHLVDFQLEQLSTAYNLLSDKVAPSVVRIDTHGGRNGAGLGSGVIVDQEGYIVTNFHVVEGVATAEIQLSDERTGTASVVGADPLLDIAVLKTELDDLIPATWAKSEDANVGDLVWAVGSPFGLSKSITSGIISAKERRFVSNRYLQEYIQTDAAVNPGNSGGPLVNIHGDIVGINTAIVGINANHSGEQYGGGISFAIPSDLARASYEKLIRDGYVERGYLGIYMQPLPVDAADALDLEEGIGILIRGVVDPSPASAAGLRRGDILVSLNDQDFGDPALLNKVIAATDVGDEVTIKVVRPLRRGDVRKLELKVKVGAFPSSPSSPAR